MKSINVILTFSCASHRDAPNVDFICKTRETHNICVLPTKNNNLRDKFPPEATGQRKRHSFHDGFPPEGAHLLKANVCRDGFLPEGFRQSKGSSFSHIRPYTHVNPIAYRIAYDIALVLLNLFRQPYHVMTWYHVMTLSMECASEYSTLRLEIPRSSQARSDRPNSEKSLKCVDNL